MSDHGRIAGPRSGHRPDVDGSVAELRLGRWDHTSHRLLARLVPRDRAGPLALVPPTVPGFPAPPLRLDVGIDVPGGIVRLDRDLLRSLATGRREIWRAAVANLALLPPPATLVVEGAAPVPLAVVAGGPWATGLLLAPSRLDGAFDPPPHRSAAGPQPVTVVVAPHPEVLVVGRVEQPSRSTVASRPTLEAVAESVSAVAGAMAEADGGARLPLAPLLVVRSSPEVLSRAHGFWNDVPVSEEPGVR